MATPTRKALVYEQKCQPKADRLLQKTSKLCQDQ